MKVEAKVTTTGVGETISIYDFGVTKEQLEVRRLQGTNRWTIKGGSSDLYLVRDGRHPRQEEEVLILRLHETGAAGDVGIMFGWKDGMSGAIKWLVLFSKVPFQVIVQRGQTLESVISGMATQNDKLVSVSGTVQGAKLISEQVRNNRPLLSSRKTDEGRCVRAEGQGPVVSLLATQHVAAFDIFAARLVEYDPQPQCNPFLVDDESKCIML